MAARDLAPIAPRLALLIPRLGTNFDGERLATVGSIDRTLRSIGRDWHDLAAAIVVRPTPEPPRPAANRKSCDWCEQVGHLLASCARLAPWEHNFCTSLLSFHQLSSKQQAVLDDIIRQRTGSTA